MHIFKARRRHTESLRVLSIEQSPEQRACEKSPDPLVAGYREAEFAIHLGRWEVFVMMEEVC